MENTSRSMNADLALGMAEGKYKRVNSNRGGVVEPTTARNRTNLSDTWWGVHEAAEKVLPDGTVHSTPDYVPTAPWRLA
jgi:hypothetical protein